MEKSGKIKKRTQHFTTKQFSNVDIELWIKIDGVINNTVALPYVEKQVSKIDSAFGKWNEINM